MLRGKLRNWWWGAWARNDDGVLRLETRKGNFVINIETYILLSTYSFINQFIYKKHTYHM